MPKMISQDDARLPKGAQRIEASVDQLKGARGGHTKVLMQNNYSSIEALYRNSSVGKSERDDSVFDLSKPSVKEMFAVTREGMRANHFHHMHNMKVPPNESG